MNQIAGKGLKSSLPLGTIFVAGDVFKAEHMRLTAKISPLFLILFLTHALTARADTILTKAGQVYKGKLMGKNNDSYSFRLDSNGEIVTIPSASVYMADFDPAPDSAFKSYLILHDGAHDTKQNTKKQDDEESTSESPPNGPSVIMPAKKYGDVLQNAQDTVALSNARTAEMQKKLEELKEIADTANS